MFLCFPCSSRRVAASTAGEQAGRQAGKQASSPYPSPTSTHILLLLWLPQELQRPVTLFSFGRLKSHSAGPARLCYPSQDASRGGNKHTHTQPRTLTHTLLKSTKSHFLILTQGVGVFICVCMFSYPSYLNVTFC